MIVTYEGDDGYSGCCSRPQHVHIYEEDILDCNDIEEAMSLIEDIVQEDFDQKISWDYANVDGILIELEQIFESKNDN